MTAAKRAYGKNKLLVFKNCAPFMDFISEANTTQVGNVKYLDVVMLMHNVIEYSHSYSKAYGSSWQYYKKESNATISKFESLKSIAKITGNAPINRYAKYVKTSVPLKHFNFGGILEMLLINCEINLI